MTVGSPLSGAAPGCISWLWVRQNRLCMTRRMPMPRGRMAGLMKISTCQKRPSGPYTIDEQMFQNETFREASMDSRGEFHEMTIIERSAHINTRLMQGEALTARQIANEYGISRQTAYYTLGMMSRVVPLYSEGGLWRVGDLCQVE